MSSPEYTNDQRLNLTELGLRSTDPAEVAAGMALHSQLMQAGARVGKPALAEVIEFPQPSPEYPPEAA